MRRIVRIPRGGSALNDQAVGECRHLSTHFRAECMLGFPSFGTRTDRCLRCNPLFYAFGDCLAMTRRGQRRRCECCATGVLPCSPQRPIPRVPERFRITCGPQDRPDRHPFGTAFAPPFRSPDLSAVRRSPLPIRRCEFDVRVLVQGNAAKVCGTRLPQVAGRLGVGPRPADRRCRSASAGRGRERPPSPRAWYGFGGKCVCAPLPPTPRVAPEPAIRPGRVSSAASRRRSTRSTAGGRVDRSSQGRVAEARDLPSALALDLGRRGRPRPRARHGPAYQRRQGHAGGRGPWPASRRTRSATRGRRPGPCGAYPSGCAATGGRGATPPPANSTGARVSWGSKGRSPSPAPGLYPG